MLFLAMLIVLACGIFFTYKRWKVKEARLAIPLFTAVIMLYLFVTIVGMQTAVSQYEVTKNSKLTFAEKNMKVKEIEDLIESKMQEEPEYAEKLKKYLDEELKKNEEDEKRFEFQKEKEKMYRMFIWPLMAE